MRPGFDKDYQYLLADLIPRHLLSHDRTEGILDALTGGNHSKMVKEAFLAMEELISIGEFTRGDPVKEKDSVVLSYIRKDGKARYSLEIANSEWDLIHGPKGRKDPDFLSSVFAGIISSLTLDESAGTLNERVEDLLNLVEPFCPGAKAYLIIFNDSSDHGLRDSETVKLLPWSKLRSRSLYRDSVTSRRIHTLVKSGDIRPGNSVFKIGYGTNLLVHIPLFDEDSAVGLLQIHISGRRFPDNNTLFNCYLLGQSIVKLLENNRHLEEMVSIDRLTDTYNRNFYETQLPLEMERASRTRKSLGFLIMDIDDFKRFNDEHGHDTGDRVLSTVASTVKNHLRKIDLFFRYGGEEFVVLLPGAGREAAERTAERIREVVAKTEMPLENGSTARITLSIGGCVYPQDADNEKELFRKADKMLLEAKQLGKNRIRFFSEGGEE